MRLVRVMLLHARSLLVVLCCCCCCYCCFYFGCRCRVGTFVVSAPHASPAGKLRASIFNPGASRFFSVRRCAQDDSREREEAGRVQQKEGARREEGWPK